MFGVLFIWVALQVQLILPDADPNFAFFDMLTINITPALSAMLALLLFAAILSTADVEIFVLSVMINKEVSRLKGKSHITQKSTKNYIIAITVICATLGIFWQDLVEIYYTLLYFLLVTGTVAFVSFFNRGNKTLAAISMSVGIILIIILTVTGTIEQYKLLLLLPALLMLLSKNK